MKDKLWQLICVQLATFVILVLASRIQLARNAHLATNAQPALLPQYLVKRDTIRMSQDRACVSNVLKASIANLVRLTLLTAQLDTIVLCETD